LRNASANIRRVAGSRLKISGQTQNSPLEAQNWGWFSWVLSGAQKVRRLNFLCSGLTFCCNTQQARLDLALPQFRIRFTMRIPSWKCFRLIFCSTASRDAFACLTAVGTRRSFHNGNGPSSLTDKFWHKSYRVGLADLSGIIHSLAATLRSADSRRLTTAPRGVPLGGSATRTMPGEVLVSRGD
jgi:hypothetical protein